CSTQNDNSLTIDFDANGVNSILAENYSQNVDGKYWFWYVAPDDFARNQGDWNKGMREITINFEVTLTDGKKYQKQVKIEIVRPPILLVHGLNGDKEKTWKDFRIGANNPLYHDKEESRFKIIQSLDMFPNAYFSANSDQLLDGINNSKSFMCWINKLREQGYACNQLDYICHSMGGSIFRNAVDNRDSYYRNSNYKKGFVHKFITLNTPHQGSSLANLLEDISDIGIFTGPIITAGAFAKLYDVTQIPYKVVDAVEDLKYKGGRKFGILEVPSHLIGGGVPCSGFNPQTQFTFKNIVKLIPGSLIFEACNGLDLYFHISKYETDFFDGNDAVVSLTSQFSGYNVSLLPSFCTPISGIMHNSIFGLSPTQSPDVFDKVNALLNSDVSSTVFSYLPSTEVISTKSVKKQNEKALTILENKIDILYPSTKLTYNAGDTMNIIIRVDTIGLKSFAVYFQDQSIYTIPSDTIVSINLTVNPEDIEGQNIVTIGNYQISGQASVSSANKDIRVNPVGSIMEFNVKPEVVVMQKVNLPDLIMKLFSPMRYQISEILI
ncbi:MAG: hypothetical protein Q7W54_07750, partial [Bacteroidota bacterium]|nr:hypothetical protein [Bacteroidota bacterium]